MNEKLSARVEMLKAAGYSDEQAAESAEKLLALPDEAFQSHAAYMAEKLGGRVVKPVPRATELPCPTSDPVGTVEDDPADGQLQAEVCDYLDDFYQTDEAEEGAVRGGRQHTHACDDVSNDIAAYFADLEAN